MPSRMQLYRERMKARGLMQVTVWSAPDDAEKIRRFAQSLMDGEPWNGEYTAAPQPAALTEPTLSHGVTGDKSSIDIPSQSITGDSISETSATDKTGPAVTGDSPEYLAAREEVLAEVNNWEVDFADLSEAQRLKEILQELRVWLKETKADQPVFSAAIEHVINDQRKRQKSLARRRR